MKLVASTTLYYPNNEFIENILEYANYFDFVLVYDNSDDNSQYVSLFQSNNRIIYFWDGNNYGLPVVFNNALMWSYENDIDFMCTFDQDSIMNLNAINSMKSCILSSDLDIVAIFAPQPVSSFNQLNRLLPKSKCSGEIVDWAICSGAFLNIKLLKKFNIKYDEAYFVDRFDVDFSLEIRKHGLSIMKYSDIRMLHTCGDDSGHSVLRHYYMFRNRFYFNNKHYGCFKSNIRTVFQIFKHIFMILIKEDQKLKKIAVLKTSYIDHKNRSYGKILDESYRNLKI